MSHNTTIADLVSCSCRSPGPLLLLVLLVDPSSTQSRSLQSFTVGVSDCPFTRSQTHIHSFFHSSTLFLPLLYFRLCSCSRLGQLDTTPFFLTSLPSSLSSVLAALCPTFSQLQSRRLPNCLRSHPLQQLDTSGVAVDVLACYRQESLCYEAVHLKAMQQGNAPPKSRLPGN